MKKSKFRISILRFFDFSIFRNRKGRQRDFFCQFSKNGKSKIAIFTFLNRFKCKSPNPKPTPKSNLKVAQKINFKSVTLPNKWTTFF